MNRMKHVKFNAVVSMDFPENWMKDIKESKIDVNNMQELFDFFAEMGFLASDNFWIGDDRIKIKQIKEN